MDSFRDLDLNNALRNALDDLGFERPTEVQGEAFSILRSGKNVIGISQTGTGKTAAYMLPILRDLKFSKQAAPRVLILVPTRELVVQVVEQVEQLTAYMSMRIVGVYGGTNINTQAQHVAQGVDILVATPGRLYDLILNRIVRITSIQKLVIDEVDVMLDLGFRPQLTNIFELLPERRQNIMFSATMTEEVEELISTEFVPAEKITIALSGTPLENIDQHAYAAPNFYSKVALLDHLLRQRETFKKTLVFASSKKEADLLFEKLEPTFSDRMGLIHSNRSQNARLRAIEEFESGQNDILVATDVIARGLDLDKVGHVINFDCPSYPENYMHRIGRTGRAEERGTSLLFYSEKEASQKEAIEALMDLQIPELDWPEEVEPSTQKASFEREEEPMNKHVHRNAKKKREVGPAFHEKKEKNKKEKPAQKKYHRELAKKYKKPKTRGDKKANLKRKRK